MNDFDEPVIIDGSKGEGGGQVLRTSLSLAAVTGRVLRMINIRAGRSRPGLRPQHLTAVRAVAAVCDAQLRGDEIGSPQLTFAPQASPHGDEYVFDVRDAAEHGSAGSVTLIFQAMLWPLLFADRPSQVTLRGGTHVPFSPPYHYLENVFHPAARRFGAEFHLDLGAWGWLPVGDGEIKAAITPVRQLQAVIFERPALDVVHGAAAVTNLPSDIAQRMANRASNLLREQELQPDIRPVRERAASPGAGIFLWLPQAGYGQLGRKGYPADKVAEDAVAELLTFIDNGFAAVDHHLADQLLIPMGLARGRSAFTTHLLSSHTFTNASVMRRWLDVEVSISGGLTEAGSVSIRGAGLTRS
ncbi:MAG TPA: RNA 3'-terminal phosphate cyclase [Candidatus Binatia bacterium]|nr:RNA 3'-terminal phosphate cyclase [Candidatus Binatia bacterium]